MPRRAQVALGGAAAAAALLVLTWFLAFHVGVLERADQALYRAFGGLALHPHVGRAATLVAHLCNPSPYVYLAAAPLLVALLRRRGWLAVAIGAVLLGANTTTQLLKPLLAHPRPASLLGGASPVAPASWPSGHATAAMSLALCCVLAAPARLRGVVAAAGAVFAVGVSYSFLALGWHYPSDVFGGFLVAAVWALLATAAIYSFGGRRAAQRQAPGSSLSQALAPVGAMLVGALLLVALVVLVRPHEVSAYAHTHQVFMMGAAAIAGTAVLLATGLMLALRTGASREPSRTGRGRRSAQSGPR